MVMYRKNWGEGGGDRGEGQDGILNAHTISLFCVIRSKKLRVEYGFGIAWLSVVSPAYNVVVIVVYIYLFISLLL